MKHREQIAEGEYDKALKDARRIDEKVMAKRREPFTCQGCGAQKTPDGTPKNAAFIWTDMKTKTRRPYCYDCDDKLIQDVPLSKERSPSAKEHLKIQIEGLEGAIADLLGASRGSPDRACNEAIYCGLVRLLQIVKNQQAQIDAILAAHPHDAELEEWRETKAESPEKCGRCTHEIGVHGLFTGCKVQGCQCPQFYRGEFK